LYDDDDDDDDDTMIAGRLAARVCVSAGR